MADFVDYNGKDIEESLLVTTTSHGLISKTDKTKLNKIDTNDLVQKSKSGILQYPITNDNGLNISLDGSNNGRIEIINNYSDINKADNIPISKMIAIKLSYIASSSLGLVILHEIYPVRGRIWNNVYNGGSSPVWIGWKLVQGECTLWTGSAIEGQTISLSSSYKLFGHIEIRTNTGICFEVPTYTSSTYDGKVFKGGDDEDFSLYGIQITFNGVKSMVINKAKIRSLLNSTTKNMTIAKVIGKP